MQGKRLAALALLLFLVACGHKAPPLPPEHITAEGITGVRFFVRPQETVVEVRLSDRYTGKPYRVKWVKLYVDRCGPECGGCTRIFGAVRKPGVVHIEDTPIRKDTCYRIYGYTERDVSVRRYVSIVPAAPAPPAVGLSLLRVRQNEVELSFSGCREGVSLYRRTSSSSYPPVPYALWGCSPFKDTSVEEGVSYCYRARAASVWQNVVYESSPSGELCITPLDFTPPPVPRNLTGIFYEGVVNLTWDPVKCPDLDGYYVYRLEGGRWIRLNSTPVRVPLFTDASPPKGKEALIYAVSSVDKKGNESAKSKPVAIRK